ncbi:MAG: DUF58 domain-containing protein [Anaerolineae bacterium]
MHKPLTLLLSIIGLLFAAVLTRNGDLVWLALPFLTYVGIGILRSPTTGQIRLRATRSAAKTSVDAVTAIEVGVTISNDGAALVHLRLVDALQAGMKITVGKTEQSVVLRAGEEALIQYTFQSERGSFAWKTIRAVVRDPFGLIESPIDLPAEAEIRVQPQLRKFRPFPLHPQDTLHSAGSIPARLAGSGTNFWGVREYHPGDPLRRLDWRLTARHPGQFFTKEFEQEEIADIGLILDARQKTDLRLGEDSLFEHSARAAASLAEVFLRQGNRVSLLIYRKHMVNVFPGYGKVQLNRILRALAQTTTEEESSFDSLQFLPLRMFSSHSLIVILSPLAAEDWQLFPRLRAYGYQVLLISPNTLDYAGSLLPTDHITQLASRLARIERQSEIDKITQLWIPVIDWQVDQPLAPLVRQALARSHIQRQR